MDLRLAYSTNGFTRVDLPSAVRAIGGHGYGGVEILADAPHWPLVGSDAAALRALRGALDEAGLRVSNINANTARGLWPNPPPETVFEPSLSHHDVAVRARRAEHVRRALDLAAAVGAPAVSVTSGRTESEVPPAEGRRYFAEALAPLCERAASLGVKIGIEYEPALLVENAAELTELIEQVNHPALGFNLDIGHAWCAGESPAEILRAHGDRVWNLHLEDIASRKHYHLVPGEGEMDFDAVFEAGVAVGYAGFHTVELYTCAGRADEAAARAFAHLAPRLRAARSGARTEGPVSGPGRTG